MEIETKCLHEGYKPGNGEPLALPIYQSTTYTYDSTEHIGKLFDLTAPGHMYSRISNPTGAYVEEKLAALEGGVGCLLTTSGQAASFMSLFNILSAGDSFIAASKIYGGTVNLFAVTMKRMGIECIFIDEDDDEETLQKAFKPNTKAVFAETLANPALSVCDIEKLARVAHKNGVPLIIDNTFPTPIFCRPIEWGADIVVHSTTKYIDCAMPFRSAAQSSTAAISIGATGTILRLPSRTNPITACAIPSHSDARPTLRKHGYSLRVTSAFIRPHRRRFIPTSGFRPSLCACSATPRMRCGLPSFSMRTPVFITSIIPA